MSHEQIALLREFFDKENVMNLDLSFGVVFLLLALHNQNNVS